MKILFLLHWFDSGNADTMEADCDDFSDFSDKSDAGKFLLTFENIRCNSIISNLF